MLVLVLVLVLVTRACPVPDAENMEGYMQRH